MSVLLYGTSKTSLGVYCSNCSDCHNQVDVALEPSVCSSADLTVTVRGADSQVLVQGAQVTVTDISKTTPVILSNGELTNKDGIVVIKSPGEARLKIDIVKDGFDFLNGSSQVYCHHPCYACNASFNAFLSEEFCKKGCHSDCDNDKQSTNWNQ